MRHYDKGRAFISMKYLSVVNNIPRNNNTKLLSINVFQKESEQEKQREKGRKECGRGRERKERKREKGRKEGRKEGSKTVIPACQGFPSGTSGKEPACQCRRHKRHGFAPWVGKIPWKRAWQPTPVFLPGESHRQRSLAGYSPEGCTELDMTEVT